jgi:hypothetical protein
MCRSGRGDVHGGRGDVHEGGRPAARPHGAISIASPSAARPRGAISNRRPLTPADGATSTKVDARRHARTARFQSLALQRHARAARFPIADLSPRRTGRRPRRWTPGGTPPRRDFNRQPFSGRSSVHEGGRPAARPHGAIFNRQPFSGTPARRDFNRQPFPLTPATHLLLQLKSLLEGWHLTRTGRRPRRWTPGGTPARRDVNRQPLPLTPAKHLVQQRPRQSKVEPFGWGRKLQCHSGLSTDRSTRIDATGAR